MRWGVRKNNSISKGPTDVELKVRPGRKVKVKGGEGHGPSEDAKKVAVSRQKARKSSTDSLSTKELQELVTRMNLEQQYSSLMSKNKGTGAKIASEGKKFATSIVVDFGKQQAKGVATAYLGKQLANMMTKSKG
jgi:hypothetical protein